MFNIIKIKKMKIIIIISDPGDEQESIIMEI